MKLTKILLAMTLVLVVVLTLASCGGPACEHAYDEVVTTVPTCTAEGVKTFTCANCGDSYTEPIEKAAHTYSETVTAPTCTEGGYTTFTCTCGDTYTDNAVSANGHDYTKTETLATCTTAGIATYTCKDCGDSYTEEGAPASGVHTYVTRVVELTEEEKAANAGAIGVKTTACEGCGAREAGAAATAVLLNLDFETEKTSLLEYVEEQTSISPFLRGSNYSNFGFIQDGVWYNAGNNQANVNANMDLHSRETFTISVDFVLGSLENLTTSDRFFAWGGCGEGSSGTTTYFFDLAIGEDNLLHAYKNSKATTEIAQFNGFAFDDRTAWYHLDLTVDVTNQTFTAFVGKWADEARTTYETYVELVVEDKGSPFHTAITAARPQEMFRFSSKNGLAAMDNFIVTVPMVK